MRVNQTRGQYTFESLPERHKAVPSRSDNFTLLLGASGILGSELVALSGTAHVVATHLARAKPWSVHFDATTTDVSTLWANKSAPPRAAVVMLGVTAIDACARDPAATALVNVQGAIRVIDRLLECGVVPVFVSSDGVFDGSRSWWSEEDQPTPILEYGRQKCAVERHLACRDQGIVVRLPKLIEDGPADRGFLPGWIQALGQPQAMLCATDQYFTPASARDAAAAILGLVDSGARGVFHVAGPQRLSRRELLAHVADEYSRFARPQAPIIDCLLGDVPVFERRPLDTSMRSSRLAALAGHPLRDAATVARAAVRAHFQHLDIPPLQAAKAHD